eukprot:8541841-Alexandrium_andersonii.AAC.1
MVDEGTDCPRSSLCLSLSLSLSPESPPHAAGSEFEAHVHQYYQKGWGGVRRWCTKSAALSFPLH